MQLWNCGQVSPVPEFHITAAELPFWESFWKKNKKYKEMCEQIIIVWGNSYVFSIQHQSEWNCNSTCNPGTCPACDLCVCSTWRYPMLLNLALILTKLSWKYQDS